MGGLWHRLRQGNFFRLFPAFPSGRLEPPKLGRCAMRRHQLPAPRRGRLPRPPGWRARAMIGDDRRWLRKGKRTWTGTQRVRGHRLRQEPNHKHVEGARKRIARVPVAPCRLRSPVSIWHFTSTEKNTVLPGRVDCIRTISCGKRKRELSSPHIWWLRSAQRAPLH